MEKSSPDAMRNTLRQAFGKFATGVTIVTAWSASGEPKGFTANSFTSVSLDPPLLLVCVSKRSSNIKTFASARAFAVNVLAEDQANVSKAFASPLADRFGNVGWQHAPAAPVLRDTLARFDCRTHQTLDAGDHIVLLGRVADFVSSEGRPLIYFRGCYADLSDRAAQLSRS